MEKFDISHVGKKFKEARISKKLTQEELAEMIDISPRYVTAIENENKCPSVDVLLKLVRVLNMSADDIFYPELKY